MKKNAAILTHPHSGSPAASGSALRSTHRAHTGQAGFTIVEVLVAVVVFGVGLLAVAGMQTQSIAQATFSDQLTMRANAITHWAETLARMPVLNGTVDVGGGTPFPVTTSDIFKQGIACEYGTTCSWSSVDYDDKESLTLRQRITRGYPLPDLVMIELEALPKGVKTKTAEARAVRTAYVRSLRWN